MQILIDLDDTIADLEGRLLDIYNSDHPDAPLKLEDRKEFYWGVGMDIDVASELWHIMRGIGFYSSLDPLPGAIEAVTELSKDHEVYIVTSAGTTLPLSPTEKYQWVERHFGNQMINRLVIARSKHVVRGDILIDDKPEVISANQAEWQQVLFDKRYNAHLDLPRLNWQNYQEVINSLTD